MKEGRKETPFYLKERQDKTVCPASLLSGSLSME
jgi:hypothetical protein